MSVFGSDIEFNVDYARGLSKNKIRLIVPGNPVDPFDLPETASVDDQLLANVLSRMGQRPKWKYSRGINTITYTPAKKGIPGWGKLVAAITATIVLGLFVRVLPDNISKDDPSHRKAASAIVTDLLGSKQEFRQEKGAGRKRAPRAYESFETNRRTIVVMRCQSNSD